ncbi:hypothetical protein MGEO_14330 [Marivita geojedonensis]|uniref:Uncharacterized protein n=1 Tax=Marivita geojedonensis TaxID=1123756 RepID=A0A1X4NIF7_9RHOB|nr:hypothetical protein MGEO_14330 [Marivita geojedonensis]
MPSDPSLEYLGCQINGHDEAGRKHEGRAEDQYRSAGLLLLQAKEQIKGKMTFPEFLERYCTIKKSRAYELIAIAEGKATSKGINDKKREANKRHREKQAASGSTEDPRCPYDMDGGRQKLLWQINGILKDQDEPTLEHVLAYVETLDDVLEEAA